MSVPRLPVAAVERVTAHIPALAASPHLLYAVYRVGREKLGTAITTFLWLFCSPAR